MKELCWFVYSTWGGRGNAHITTEGMDTHNHKNITKCCFKASCFYILTSVDTVCVYFSV